MTHSVVCYNDNSIQVGRQTEYLELEARYLFPSIEKI